MKPIFTIALLSCLLFACKSNVSPYDAAGTFEAVETIVAADASGTILALNLEEGQTLKAGQEVGYIDSMQLYLKKKQLQEQIKAVLSKKPDVNAQTAALQEQLKQAVHEQQRISNLVKADAATPKQLDDANAQIAVIKKQINAMQSTLGITAKSINEETSPIEMQIMQINDQLRKTKIINQVEGTVLTKYAEVSEITTVGKPIYKIGALNSIILRAYLTNDQLGKIKINQQVNVLVDQGKDAYKTYPGTIEWISEKAEFTPKTIQTKDERANLVYAVKIKVKNDGFIKIGMYGEVKL